MDSDYGLVQVQLTLLSTMKEDRGHQKKLVFFSPLLSGSLTSPHNTIMLLSTKQCFAESNPQRFLHRMAPPPFHTWRGKSKHWNCFACTVFYFPSTYDQSQTNNFIVYDIYPTRWQITRYEVSVSVIWVTTGGPMIIKVRLAGCFLYIFFYIMFWFRLLSQFLHSLHYAEVC